MKHENVTLSMGAGGKLSAELVEEVFLPAYGNKICNTLDDAAELTIGKSSIAFTTDSFTVKPIFFPGGDIGTLAICGTANDLAVKGARPVAISVGFIIEDGFPMVNLKKIAASMQKAAASIGVKIVTGDTKVVGKKEADGIFINTSGIGATMPGMCISCTRAKCGDDIIITGTIADHGIAILNARQNLDFEPVIESDVAPVLPIVEAIADYGKYIHVMRDPTRGGIASVINEIAKASRVNVRLYENRLPVKKSVISCCNLFGLDPLYVPNEGKIVLFVDHRKTEDILEKIKSVPEGENATVIGKVLDTAFSQEIPPVHIETALGTRRFVPLLDSEPLPRIC